MKNKKHEKPKKLREISIFSRIETFK